MSPVRSVYVMTDLEGVAGVDAWDPRHEEYADTAKGVAERAEMQRLLTGEVNAAVRGLRNAGVEEILINDAHGAGRTILSEELEPGVKLARGVERPSWLLGISSRFDALVQVGMHAMGGTANACLCHSMSVGKTYRVNGVEVGEMEIAALLAGELGIPWIFTSGDHHACREAEYWVPGMAVAPVKEGLDTFCAIHLTPTDARDLIYERIQDAVEAADEIDPLTLDQTPVEMTVRRETPWELPLMPGAQLVDDLTLRYVGETFWEIFHAHTYGKPDFSLPV